MSLGGGLHFCVGAPLARLEMEIALSVLVEVLGDGARIHPGPFANTYHFHGLTELRLGGNRQ